MTSCLYRYKMCIFDYPTAFAKPLRDMLRANAEAIAKENGLEIEFIRKGKSFRKEERIRINASQRRYPLA